MKEKTKNNAGGAATSGGINFQAAVTAIASVHIAGSAPLRWLDGLCDDTPIKVEAETDGAGDDLKLIFKDNKVAEVQVKKGFRKGSALWTVLSKLAVSVNNKEIDFGILVICPNSSDNIAKHLANDIRRIGEGRDDKLKPISLEFTKILTELNLPLKQTCSKLRIVTVHALKNDSASLLAAEAILTNVCVRKDQVPHAWKQLYSESLYIMENRGAIATKNILQSLKSVSIEINHECNYNVLQTLDKLINTALQSNSSYSIWGLQKPLSLENDWISVPIYTQKEEIENASNLLEALTEYHNWTKNDIARGDKEIEPLTLGRFYKHVVIKAGPGMGKTTLLKRLALHYAQEGFPVIIASLRNVSQRMKSKGETFEESLLTIGLDNRGVSPTEFKAANFQNVVYLLDALDECGHERANIAKNISDFKYSHPDSRILVTTRIIGYEDKYLPNWRQYKIMPLPEDSVSKTLAEFLKNHLGNNHPKTKIANGYAQTYSDKNPIKKFIARSPLLLTLVASLSINGVTFNQGRSNLYSKIFKLFDNEPHARLTASHADIHLMHRILDILAFELIKDPTCEINALQRNCAKILQNDIDSNNFLAMQHIKKGINYWQEIGVLEAVVFSSEEIITFIHLTFAEYAAARYLASITEKNIKSLLPSILNASSYSETIRFASEMDSAEIIYKYISLQKGGKIERHNALNTRLNIAANPDVNLSEALINKLLDDAINYVQSNPKNDSLKIAESIIPLAIRFPELTADKFIQLKKHNVNWIRLISFTCLIQCGFKYITLNELENALIDLPDTIAPYARKYSKGYMLYNTGKVITDELICKSTFVVLTTCSDEEATHTLKNAYAGENHWTVGLRIRLEQIFSELNKQHIRHKVLSDRLSRSIKNNIDFEKMQKDDNAVNKAIFSNLSIPQESLEIEEKQFFYHLASFLNQSDYWESASLDIRELRPNEFNDIIKEVFKTFIKLSGLSTEGIGKEANAYLKLMRADKSGNFLSSYEKLPYVDVPDKLVEIDKELIDIQKILLACSHPSLWIVRIAFYVLASTLKEEELLDACKKLIISNNGHTLQLIPMVLSDTSKPELVIDLYKQRLNSGLCEGCQYLYKHMSKLCPEYDSSIQEILDIGLASKNPRIVESTAIFTKQFFKCSPRKILKSLNSSFDCWLKIEKPYPQNSGVVPESPRKEILTCIFKLSSPTYQDIKLYLNDTRPDVSNLAKSEFLKIIINSPSAKSQFIVDLISAEIDIHLLSSTLAENEIFLKDEIVDLTALLTNLDPETRYVAMDLLDLKFLNCSEIKEFTIELLQDDEIVIRERTEKILNDLSP